MNAYYTGPHDPVNAPINQMNEIKVFVERGRKAQQAVDIEVELAEIAQKYAEGIVNTIGRSFGLRTEDFYPIIYKACKESALMVGLEAGGKMEELMDQLNEAKRWLRKYQARYHGAEHAKKLWKHVDEFLSRTSLEALSRASQGKAGETQTSDQPE